MNDIAQLQSNLKTSILDLSRQSKIGALSPWFDNQLDYQIGSGLFLDESALHRASLHIIRDLALYRAQSGASVVVLGMSGGVDSALTAALFKEAGYAVIGVTMPIHQVQAETDRGIEACEAIGIKHIHKDLSALYDAYLDDFSDIDSQIGANADVPKDVLIRRGNIRARVRMTTLYNLAALYGGFVASTDNFSELAAGFWTLHGDVGDVSPIQSLLKSWEVPLLAKINGVPESTWRATPTDGLGIDAGDEAQLGASYLEWDLMVHAIAKATSKFAINGGGKLADIRSELAHDARAATVFDNVTKRIGGSWFKRMNPVNLRHPYHDRYAFLTEIDGMYFIPPVVR